MIDGTLVLVGYLGPLEPALDSTPLVFRRKESVRCGRRPGIGRARASSGQQLDQPGDARITGLGCIQRMQLDHALGKTRNCGARIPESHSTCAVAIQQGIQLWPFLEFVGLTSNIAKVFIFLQEGIEVVEPIGIEKPKSREVSGHAE